MNQERAQIHLKKCGLSLRIRNLKKCCAFSKRTIKPIWWRKQTWENAASILNFQIPAPEKTFHLNRGKLFLGPSCNHLHIVTLWFLPFTQPSNISKPELPWPKSHREIRPKNFQDNFLGLQTEPPQFRGPVQHKAQVDRQTSQEPKHPKSWDVVGCWMQLSCSIQSQMCHGSDLLIENLKIASIVPRALLGHLTTCLTPTVNLHFISSKNLLALLKHANFQEPPR